jgi:hypothetical protein
MTIQCIFFLMYSGVVTMGETPPDRLPDHARIISISELGFSKELDWNSKSLGDPAGDGADGWKAR